MFRSKFGNTLIVIGIVFVITSFCLVFTAEYDEQSLLLPDKIELGKIGFQNGEIVIPIENHNSFPLKIHSVILVQC